MLYLPDDRQAEQADIRNFPPQQLEYAYQEPRIQSESATERVAFLLGPEGKDITFRVPTNPGRGL